MSASALKASKETAQSSSENYTKAILNILEDFTGEKDRLEGTQRAVLNILDDFSAEKGRLESTQKAMLNLLEDFDKSNLQLTAEMEERKRVEEQVKKSLTEKEALLKEIHHRVKNNLQIIQSMLNLQISQLKDEMSIALFKESQNRVYSMALIHEKLYQSESLAKINFHEYIRSLVNHLFLSYGAAGRAIKSKIVMEDIYLDVDTTIPCALIINELISNSLKHAFPASQNGEKTAGEILISLTHNEGGSFFLTVSDNGAGLPEGLEIQNCNSLGLKLVNALVTQLNGGIHIESGIGTKFTISFETKS